MAEVSYEVLYYKRKANKVHKSKGVSKMDGILKILRPPQSKVVLKDGENTVYHSIQPDIAKRADSLKDEEVLILGAYEVEVIEMLNDSKKKDTSLVSSRQPLLLSRQTKSFVTKRMPLHPKSNPLLRNRPSIYPATRQVVRVPHLATASQDRESEDSSEDDALMKENPQNRIALLAKRPLLSSKSGSFPKFRKVVNIPKRRKVALSASSASVATESSVMFPEAVEAIDIPHSIKSILRPHQVSGVSFLWNCLTGHGKAIKVSPHVVGDQKYNGAILADEMGLGKTLMTIAVVCAFYRQRRDRRFVVVCPSSLVKNWAKEFDKWLGKASQPKRVVIEKGGKEGLSRIRAWSTKSQSEILIISYDLLRMNSNEFNQVQKVHLLVVDEGHRLKNTAGSLTLSALESLKCQARLCITATPIQNVLSDFFKIANFVCPGLLGDLPSFRREYERPISASNNKNCSIQQRRKGLAASRVLDEITKTFVLRRLQKDILKSILPPRHECLLFCSPTNTQRLMYNGLTRGGNFQNATADALKVLINLRKLCSHPLLLKNNEYPGLPIANKDGVEDSGKVKVLSALINEIRKLTPKDKVVIVSNFTSALTMIEDTILKPREISYLRLDGTTELSNRQGLVDTFNATSSDRYFAFLLSSKAGGCGLNLIGANRLIMFDPDWNPASDIQAMARIYRQGQTKSCWIYRMFTAGTVEEVICQRQIQKGNLATRAVDAPSSGGITTNFTKEELQNCFSLKENCDCDTKAKVGDQWPAYSGASSIEFHGFCDRPLLEVAADQAIPLSFVHVVREVDHKENKSSSPSSKDSEDDISSSSEEEFQLDSPHALKFQEKVYGSSDEEFEFE